MAAASFEDALRRLLAHEGGYANHPSDPGGPTKYGVTLAVYRQYVMPDATAADVKAMKAAEAKAIYRAKYWNALACDLLPAGVDYALFDYGVNSGTARAAKVVQRIVGAPAIDGVIGEATLARVRARDPKELVAALCDERLAFLRRLKTWPVFGTGWARRVGEVRAAALGLAGARGDCEAPSTPAGGKGVVPVDTAAQKGTAGGVVATGGTAAQAAHEAGMRPAVIVAIVVVTIALAVAAWLFWRWRQKRLQEAAVPRSGATAAALAVALLATATVWPAHGRAADAEEAKFRRDVARLKDCATLDAIRARAATRPLTAYEQRLKAELVPWYLAHCRRGSW